MTDDAGMSHGARPLNVQGQDVIYAEEFAIEPDLIQGCLTLRVLTLLLVMMFLSFSFLPAGWEFELLQPHLYAAFREALFWMSLVALVTFLFAGIHTAFQAYQRRPYRFKVEVDSQQIRYHCYGNDFTIPLRSIREVHFLNRDPNGGDALLRGLRALLIDVGGPKRAIVPTQQPEQLVIAIDRALWIRE